MARPLTIAYTWRLRSFIYAIFYRDLKLRYANSILGVAWMLIEPLMLVTALTLAFKFANFKGADTRAFPIYFYAGILPWNMFRSAITQGCDAFAAESALLRKHTFPKEIIVGKNIFILTLDLLVSSVALLIIMPFFDVYPGTAWFMLPFVLMIQLILCAGAMLFLATMSVYIPDIKRFMAACATLLFWMTPVVFDYSQTSWGQILCQINPMAGIVLSFREIILNGQVPGLNLLVPPALFAVGVFCTGYFVFRKCEGEIVDVL